MMLVNKKATTNWSEEKIALLNENIRVCETLISAMNDIKDGMSESNACRKYDIDKGAFRNFMSRQLLGYKKPEGVADEKDILNHLSWADQVWRDMYGKENSDYIKTPEELDASMDFILENSIRLTDSEKSILRMYYKEGLSYREIEQIKGYSSANIGYVKKRALKKLGSGNEYLILKYGLETAEQLLTMRKEGNEASQNRAIGNMRKSLEKAQSDNDIEALKKEYAAAGLLIKQYEKNLEEERRSGKQTEKKIEDLGLSVRTVNMLKRRNIDTLSDFISKGLNDIRNILAMGNMGEKTVFNIIRMCENNDIPIETGNSYCERLYARYQAKKDSDRFKEVV